MEAFAARDNQFFSPNPYASVGIPLERKKKSMAETNTNFRYIIVKLIKISKI